MSQVNTKLSSGFTQPGPGRKGYGFDSVGNPVMINENGTTTILATKVEGVPNIAANRGVGLEVNLPTTFVQGDIYVTTDTLLVYTANDIISWNAVDLVEAQFVTDYDVVLPILYQYDGTSLVFVAGASSAPVNWLDFVPQDPVPAFAIGRIFYDEVEHTHTFYNDIDGISLQIGEELRARLENDTGFTLLDGKAVAVIGAIGPTLQVELLDTSNLNSSIRGFGLMTIDTLDGQPGYAVRYGVVRNLNTLSLNVGDIVYGDPDNPGEWTSVRPLPPNYPVRIGICLASHATEGAIGVDTLAFNGSDTSVNIQGALNGMVTQTPDLAFSVSGGIIYADITNENHPTKNLPFLLGGMRYYLDTTTGAGAGGAARVTVPPGASSSDLQESFVYIYLNGGVPTLAIATSEPSVPYAPVADLMAFNAARTLADGEEVFGYRRSNNAIDLLDGVHDGGLGLLVDFLAAFRQKLGSNWLTGQDGTPTVDNSTIRVALSAGVGRQFRKQNLPSFDGLEYVIYNDETNTVTYDPSTNLIDIEEDANGNSLLVNNTYYILRLFYELNSNGVVNRIIATRPLGTYSSASAAQSDGLNYATPIGDTKIEEIIYPLYDIIIGRTGALGVNVSLIELRNRKSKLATGGGGGGAQGESLDEKFRVSADDTTTDFAEAKVIVGSGLTRTILNPAGNEQMEFKIGGALSEDVIFNTATYDFTLRDSATPTHRFNFGPTGIELKADDTIIEIYNASGILVTLDTGQALGFAADYSGDYDNRSVADVGYINSHLGGQNVDALIINPTVSEDGYVISWNNTNSEYELVSQAGGGDVSKVGTPVDNQVGVWTGDGSIEGTAGLTYDGSDLDVTGNITLDGTVDGIDIGTAVPLNTDKVSNATHTGDVTGDEELTIAVGAVDIAMLSAIGTPDASNFLRGDNTWAIPDDTTYTFENGLNQSVGVAKLGGQLTENTSIGSTTNEFDLYGRVYRSDNNNYSYSNNSPAIYAYTKLLSTAGDNALASIGVFNDGSDNFILFEADGTITLADIINSKGIIYSADYSANFTARSLGDVGYIDSTLGGQDVDALIISPTATEDGYVIAWNNSNSEYELVSQTGGSLPSGVQGEILYHNGSAWVVLAVGTDGDVLTTHSTSANPTWETPAGASYTFSNGLNEAAGAVKLGGALTADTDITGAFDLSLGTFASKLVDLNIYTSVGINLNGGFFASTLDTNGHFTLAFAGVGRLQVGGPNTILYTNGTLPTIANDGDVPHKLYTDSTLGGQDVDTLIITPTSGQDGYVIAWNDTNSEYELVVNSGSGTVDTSGTPVANDFARFTDANTIEGRSYSEVRTDLGLVIGTDVQGYKTAASGLPSTSGAGDISFSRANDYYSETAITANVTWGLTNIAVDKLMSVDMKVSTFSVTLVESGITFKGAVNGSGVVQGLDTTKSNLISIWAETATLMWVTVILNEA